MAGSLQQQLKSPSTYGIDRNVSPAVEVVDHPYIPRRLLPPLITAAHSRPPLHWARESVVKRLGQILDQLVKASPKLVRTDFVAQLKYSIVNNDLLPTLYAPLTLPNLQKLRTRNFIELQALKLKSGRKRHLVSAGTQQIGFSSRPICIESSSNTHSTLERSYLTLMKKTPLQYVSRPLIGSICANKEAISQ